VAPLEACGSYVALYHGLKELQADIHQHVHLENNVLFPGAEQLEVGELAASTLHEKCS
jgi:regulator of cell morphogenesis and NO signaling